MTNAIPLLQVAEQQLRRLGAQRRLYAWAKQILAWQMILSVVFVVIWSLFVLWIPALKVYAALGLA